MPHTLLLADDSVTIQRVIELTFAEEDVQVVAVSDGDQAIARLQTAPPDIVLADIGMPGKSGYEVADYVRHSPSLSHIPVVLLTGAFEPVDQARANEAGCEAVLAKPFEPQLVISRVKELLAKRHGLLDAPIAPPPAAAPEHGAASAAGATAADLASAEPASLDAYFDRLDAAFSLRDAEPGQPPVADHPPSNTGRPEVDWFSAAPIVMPPPQEPWGLSTPAPAEPAVQPPVTFASAEPPAVADSGTFDASAWLGASSAADASAAAAADPAVHEAAASLQPAASPASATPPAIAAPVESAAAHLGVGAAASGAPRAVSMPLPAVNGLPPLADAFAALLAAEGGEQGGTSVAWPLPAPAAPPITDEIVEAIARRVLERLNDRVLRDAAAEAVSRVAEQLVRDEIERIKASIR